MTRTAAAHLPALAILMATGGVSISLAGPAGATVPREVGQPVATPSLGELRERAIGMLVELSSDADPQVRANAVEGLADAPGRLPSVIALAVLDENEGVRAVALMVGGRQRVASLAPSARLNASDPSPFVRAAALYALKRLDQSPDLTPLAEMLLDDPEPRVRAHAAFILGELGEESALSMLRQAAGRPMPRAAQSATLLMRLQMAEAMIKLGDDSQIHTLHAALYPSRPEDLEAAALAAQILGEVDARRSIPDLINLALAKDEAGNHMPAEIRLAAARSVARLGRRDGDFIADEYASSDVPAIRAQVAAVYSDTLDRAGLGALIAMLDDPEPAVRVAAAAGLLDAVNRLSGR